MDQRLLAMLDRWIPEQLRNSLQSKLQARITVGLLFGTIAFFIVIQPVFLVFRTLPMGKISLAHGVGVAVIALCTAALLHFRRSGSFALCGLTLCGMVYFASALTAFAIGVYPNTMTLLFLAVPPLAFVIQGQQAGYTWFGLVVAGQILLTVLSEAGLLTIGIHRASFHPYLELFHTVSATFFVSASFAVFAFYNSVLAGELSFERDKLSSNNLRDDITGVWAQESFLQYLENASASPDRRCFALFIIDSSELDHYRERYGSALRNEALTELSKQLCASLRDSDIVARIAETRFAVIIHDIFTPDVANRIGLHIEQACNHPLQLTEHNLRINCYIGAALWPLHGTDGEDILKCAYQAIDQCREQGDSLRIYTH